MIEIDYRIGSINLRPLIANLGVATIEADLSSADFAFWGNGPDETPIRIGIERKIIPDLIASLRDERLVGGQLPDLLTSYQRVYLFVEGKMRRSWREEGMLEYSVEIGQKEQGGKGFCEWTTGFGSAANWYNIMGRLTGLEEVGVRVRRPVTMADTAAQVVSLYQWWNKPYSEHQSHNTIKHIEVNIKKASWTAKVARALGLGHAAARVAEKVFPSPWHLVSALPDKLMELGVVKSKAMATKIARRSQGVESGE